jgi:molybdopterin-guanine dinucleotide biosynthesis protein A
MKTIASLSLVIQAGGESRRMGQDKALVPFLGRPLIQRVMERMAGIAAEVLVTTNHPEAFSFLGVRLAGDLQPERSSLGGLYTAIHAARGPLVGVVACDMPFASPALLAGECDLLESGQYDVVIPRSAEGFEPLHAVYRRETCLLAIRAALEAGERRMVSWFPSVKVKVLAPEEVLSYDPGGRAFININTPEELHQAEELARGDQSLEGDRSPVE